MMHFGNGDKLNNLDPVLQQIKLIACIAVFLDLLVVETGQHSVECH